MGAPFDGAPITAFTYAKYTYGLIITISAALRGRVQ